jgi:hypothetical protein
VVPELSTVAEYIEEEEDAQRMREKVGKMGKLSIPMCNRWYDVPPGAGFRG